MSHINDCPRIDNLVKKSCLIENIDEYYQHLTNARKRANKKDVYFTSFSTRPYKADNESRREFYKNDIDFIKDKECEVYRLVTVHSHEKLLFLKELVADAVNSKSLKYYLAYLNIKEFSDDKLPEIVGMDIIGNEVIIADFRYARALRENAFEEPIYIESEEIADKFRRYYEKIWDDIKKSSDENNTPAARRRYKGYILYDGLNRRVHENIENIWKEIEEKIPEKIEKKPKTNNVQ
jgi:hypothetical protein